MLSEFSASFQVMAEGGEPFADFGIQPDLESESSQLVPLFCLHEEIAIGRPEFIEKTVFERETVQCLHRRVLQTQIIVSADEHQSIQSAHGPGGEVAGQLYGFGL